MSRKTNSTSTNGALPAVSLIVREDGVFLDEKGNELTLAVVIGLARERREASQVSKKAERAEAQAAKKAERLAKAKTRLEKAQANLAKVEAAK